MSSADGGMHGAAATAAAKESESWEEFIHPLFRRGRRDLLVGIKRHKDGGRLKRKQGVWCDRADGVHAIPLNKRRSNTRVFRVV